MEPPVAELSVVWNPYLQRWLMMYLNENAACIEAGVAERPAEPWSQPTRALCSNDYPALYGAFMHPRYFEDDGQTVYFLMSQFGPYNVFLMKAVFRRSPTSVSESPRSARPRS